MLKWALPSLGALACLVLGQDFLPSTIRDGLAMVVPAQASEWLSSSKSWPGGEPESFEHAKELMWEAYKDYPVEIYCGCVYEGRRMRSDCPIQTPVHADRADRVEWEHVVPASSFGQQRSCWREAPEGTSGRDHCREVDPVFRVMEGDPLNLRPSNGALNAIRSNYRFGEVPSEPRQFGGCDFEVSKDGEGRYVEPPENVKGDVARVYFYFENRYGLKIGRSQRRLFDAWSRMDPIDQVERAMHAQVAIRTGVCNPFIDGPQSGLPCPAPQ